MSYKTGVLKILTFVQNGTKFISPFPYQFFLVDGQNIQKRQDYSKHNKDTDDF